MNRLALLLICSLPSVALSATEPARSPIGRTGTEWDRDGQDIAAKLRDAAPDRESEYHGVLLITPRDGKATEIPIHSKITLTPTNWMVTYRAKNEAGSETLAITHSPNQPNHYQLQIAGRQGTSSEESTTLKREELNRPFAGSDFWIIDLGLEFAHWPRQRKVKNEMRRSRSCNVLESINPNAGAASYARVLTWVDVETGGIVRAEAFDRLEDSRPAKEFELGSLRKVDGQHQLESMKIRSKKTGQETELKFELPKK